MFYDKHFKILSVTHSHNVKYIQHMKAIIPSTCINADISSQLHSIGMLQC
jgi:hypothetical protein